MKPISLDEKQLINKTVLVRVDYNVPLKNQKVVDDSRIKTSLPTLKLLQKLDCKIILLSHFGRPGGKKDANLSLEPVAQHLAKLLQTRVELVNDCVGSKVVKTIAKLKSKEVLVLENVRFYAEEKKNTAKFAQKLSALADVYVNEAFSACHRSHASIVGIPQFLPSYAGLALVKEVETLSKLMKNPARPFVMVVGGAKISDKIDAVTNLSQIADAVLVGGGVANNFLKADGYEIANSYLQDVPADLKKQNVSYVTVAKKIIDDNKTQRLLKDDYIPLPKILYPIDVVTAKSINSQKTKEICLANGEKKKVTQDLMYLDIGEKTTRLYQEIILQAKTIFWNGPMGVFEQPQFSQGTKEIARTIAKAGAMSIVGGGDTICAINKFDLQSRYNYVSAAGGASLEFLSGKELPGLKVLEN